MSKGNKYLTAILIVQVALLLVLGRESETSTALDTRPLLADFDREQVSQLAIWDESSDEPAITLSRKGDAWVASSHGDYPVLASKISAALASLDGATIRRTLATQEHRLQQLGVAEHDFERRIQISAGGKQHELFLGERLGSTKTATRRADSAKVHATSGLRSSTFPASLSAWVDTTYFQVDEEQIAMLSISNEQGIHELSRKDDNWTLAQESAAVERPALAVDDEAMGRLLRALSKIRLRSAAALDSMSGAPLATAILKLKGGGEHTIDVYDGKSDDELMVHERQHEHVVAVAKSSLASLLEVSSKSLSSAGDANAEHR